MILKTFLIFATGLTLFLLGMFWLSATVQRNFTSTRIREHFALSVKRPIYGIVTGAFTTILFQSSSATSVLAVGLVGAGLISFFHSLGIILGADIGTTLTVQLVVWKITDISPVFIVFGSLLWLLGKGKWKPAGEAVLYFGLIFFGLSLVSYATEPLKDSEAFISFFRGIEHPLYGLLIGFAVTALIQSSAVTISVLVILASHGLISIDIAIPIVFGANIGTAATALLASLTSNVEGKKCAISHFFFKLTGAVFCLLILPLFLDAVKILSSETPQQIALGHFLFNCVIVLIFTPILKPFASLVEKMIPQKGDLLPIWPEFLDERQLFNVHEALNCTRKELERETVIAQKMVGMSVRLIEDFSDSEKTSIEYIESVVDNLRHEIGDYLCKISFDTLSIEVSQKLFSFSAIADDSERIADHALTLSNLAERKHRRKILFTEEAMSDLRKITELVLENIADVIGLIRKKDGETIETIIEREDLIDRVVRDARGRHLERHYKRLCTPEAGPIFVDILIHLERISDHCENIAEHIQDIGASA
jgi:phosphate:Na+ symporter